MMVKKVLSYILLGLIAYCYLSLYRFGIPLWDSAWSVGWLLVIINLFALALSYFADQKMLPIILVVSVLIQVALFGLQGVHNDVYRYLWDGWVSTQGVSPFAYTPDQISSQNILSGYQNFWYWDLLDFKHLHTIYPATAQLFFFIGSLIHAHSVSALRFILFLCGIISMILAWVLTKDQEEKHLRKLFPFVFLSSLWIFDGVIAVHLEMLIVAFLLLSIWLYQKKYYYWLGVALACLIFTKLYPLVIVPFFVRRKNWLKTIFVGIVTGLVINIPFFFRWEYAQNLFHSLDRFSSQWVMSPILYDVITYLYNVDWGIIMGILMSVLIIVVALLYYKHARIYHAVALVLSIYILCSKTIFSWYLLPVLALYPFIISPYRSLLLVPLLFFPLQYSFIDGTTEVNTTFVYLNFGRFWWFYLVLLGSSIIIWLYIVIRELILNKMNCCE